MNETKKPVIISFPSWKGGTGKTTIAAACIYILSERGYKMLIIDLDSNLSMTTCFDCEGENYTSYSMFSGFKGEPLKVTDNIDIIPSQLENSLLANMSENTLRNKLKEMDLSEYDYVFIDPPGTMNSLTRNAIAAADKIIIPCILSRPDSNATVLVFNELASMGSHADISIFVNRVEIGKYDHEILKNYFDDYQDFIYDHFISSMISLNKLTKNVFKYHLKGRAKSIIERFVDKVIL